MTIKEIYRIWAPIGKRWVEWVRPVPFVGISEYSPMYSYSNLKAPDIDYIDRTHTGTAIIVDLPGEQSVEEGIGLARLGFRPIPIFNGTTPQPGARGTVDVQGVGEALMWGASELVSVEIDDNALPAFLLDKNRLHRYKMNESIFDNSWDVYPQDMPSAQYLIDNGIVQIIVVGDSISRDLKKIFREYRKKKIKIKEVHKFG